LLPFTPGMISAVLTSMKAFENDLNDTFNRYGYNLRDNTGRRNALVSQAQEREVANVLRTVFHEVIEDGSPGQPDVVVKDINKELECKLTSGTGDPPTYALQTDWDTLQRKGSLDYMWIICNKDFDKFCILYFEGLTTDDFIPPASGSRGKSRMNKKLGMQKVTCLHGRIGTQNEVIIQEYIERMGEVYLERTMRLKELQDRYNKFTDRAKIGKEKTAALIKTEQARFDKKITNIASKIALWEGKDPRYTFNLTPIADLSPDIEIISEAA